MRLRYVLVTSAVLTVARLAATSSEQTTPITYSARVRVTDRVLNTVNPMVFGDNIEWVHHGMGLWRPENQVFDEALVQELKAAGVTHLRYPGGTLSDFFDWRAAVDPNRRPQPNPFDKGHTEYPDFGPDEFMALCRRLGIPGTITVNAGTGTPEMAGEWAGYLRGKGFKVTQFEVGNEIYMADAKKEEVPSMPIAKTADQYVDFYLRTYAAIRKAWPGARVGAIGLVDTGAFPLNRHADWLEKLLTRAGDRLEFIAIHNGYAPATTMTWPGGRQQRQSDDDVARCFLGASEYVRRNIDDTKAALAKHAPNGGRRIGLMVTEYGPLVYPLDPAHAAEDLAWNRSLAGALYQACLFNVFLREPRIVGGNHLPLCQDGFGALVGIRGAGPQRKHWRNVVFHVFRLYSGLVGRAVLDTVVEGPTYAAATTGIVPALKDVPLIDAAAYRSKDRRSTKVCLVNRDITRAASVRIDPGAGQYRVAGITTVAAESYKAENGAEKPDAVKPVSAPGPTGLRTGPFEVTLPKHSLTVIEFALMDVQSKPPSAHIR